MLLELADLDGDVDAAVTILRRGDHPRYGAMLERLDSAGRRDEAVAVIDQAVERRQRLSLRRNGPRASDYLARPRVRSRSATSQAGRSDDAMQVLRGVFEREPGVPSLYQLLLGVAARLDEAETQREWAIEHA